MKKRILSKSSNAVTKSNRRRQGSSPNSPEERPTKRQKMSSSENNSRIREVYISSKSINKWRCPSDATLKFAMDLIDGNVELSLATVDSEDYEDVREMLNILRERLKNRFTKLMVPLPKAANYHCLNKTGKIINTELVQNIDQIKKIDTEMEDTIKVNKKLEKRKAQLEESVSNATTEDGEQEEEDGSCQDEMIKTLQAVISFMEREHPTEADNEQPDG